nr:integrase, catalytic region, zinc finger, CCHC-type, peptidase aspartic, catalytic [Tanacetum cinerariifolium]
NGLIGVQGNGIQNQIGNGNLVAIRAEGNAAGKNRNQIRCYNYRGISHYARNCTARPRRRDAAYLQTQLLIAQKEEEGIQLQAEEYDLMAAAADLDEIEEVNANCILMANLQQASSSGTKTDSAPVYDSDESAEVHENYDNNEIFNMFTQEEQYTELLEPIPEPQQVPQNDNNVISENDNDVISEDTNVEQGGETVEQHPANFEETYTLYESLYQNLAIEVEKVNSVNRVDNTKTRRPQPMSNTKHDMVPSASKSSRSNNKEAEVEEHYRNLLLSKNNKHISSACNNFMLDSQNVYSKVVCAMCKQCLISVNHNECLLNYVNNKNSRGKKQSANVSIKEKQKKRKPTVKKPKKVEPHKSLATPTPRKPRSLLKWSPTGRMFDINGKIIASSESESQSDCSKGDNACTSNHVEPTIERFPNATFSLAVGNILITKVHFVEGLGHNLFSVGQFYNSDLEVTFRRDACFIRNLEGVDLLKGDHSTNLYTINLHEIASASPIYLMARASSTKSWLWHQRLSHLNFDTINDLSRNDLVTGLPKFKYHKEHLCPSCEQGKSKRASHPPKPVPNSRQRLHLLHMDLYGPMRIASINEKRKPDISFLHVFGALCYPKNDREDIGKLGAKGDIGFFIRYSADSCAYRIYNRRTKKIIETMNVSFNELSAMAFEQSSSKPGLNSMTSGYISSGLDLTYAPSTITT